MGKKILGGEFGEGVLAPEEIISFPCFRYIRKVTLFSSCDLVHSVFPLQLKCTHTLNKLHLHHCTSVLRLL